MGELIILIVNIINMLNNIFENIDNEYKENMKEYIGYIVNSDFDNIYDNMKNILRVYRKFIYIYENKNNIKDSEREYLINSGVNMEKTIDLIYKLIDNIYKFSILYLIEIGNIWEIIDRKYQGLNIEFINENSNDKYILKIDYKYAQILDENNKIVEYNSFEYNDNIKEIEEFIELLIEEGYEINMDKEIIERDIENIYRYF